MVITVTLNPAVDRILQVPGFRVGAHAQAELKSLLPAGKGVNVARGIARLGGSVAACGFVGRDEERMFAESLRGEGIDARFCLVAGRTRTNTTVLDPEAHTSTHLREAGFCVGPADVTAMSGLLSDSLADLSGDATVVFAGSLPEGMGADDFVGLLRAVADHGGTVVVDTSGPALRAAAGTRLVDVLTPNLLELGDCLGRKVERDDAVAGANELLASVSTVLLTLGGEGAVLIRQGLTVGCACPLEGLEVRNTVGCGDAFLAGWLRAGQMGKGPAEALCWAVAAGAASAMSEQTAGCTLADVRGLLPRCRQTLC